MLCSSSREGADVTPNTVVRMIWLFSGLVDLAIGAGLIALGVYLNDNYERALQWRGMYFNIAASAALLAAPFVMAYGIKRERWGALGVGVALIALSMGLGYWKSLLPWTGYVVGVVGAGLALWGIGLVVWNTVMLVVFGVSRAASAGWNAGRDRSP
jgi:uncharacterized integral membrane protein